MFDFTDKNILVTGASRGIGRTTAQLFAQQGGTVAVHYNSNKTAAEEALASLDGDGHIIVQAQANDPAAVQACVEQTVSELGSIDILVNNAGVYEDHGLADVSYEQWQASWSWILGVNLQGAANFCYCAGQHMIKQGSGRIVNVSSRGAFRGEPTSPAYGASKAALNSMSQSLAKYLAPYGIYVAVAAPGFVETEMATEALAGESGVAIRSQSPLNRVATPYEVAYPIVFLASEGAEWMTGSVLDINGASYLRT